MGDTESCSSRAVDFAPVQSVQSRKQRQKVEVYNGILCRLRDLNIEEASFPAFEDELWAHFSRLPSRYAFDVNVERAQDVLMHKRLLEKARDPACRPAIEVRLVQFPSEGPKSDLMSHLLLTNVSLMKVHSASDGNRVESVKFARKADPQGSDYPNKKRVHPPPAFGTLSDLELLHEDKRGLKDMDVVNNVKPIHSGLMHEITISTNDKPKLLTQLTSLLSEVGLNIQEAHAFSTTDGYSLDVFVVDGWALEETEQLRNVLIKKISKVEKQSWLQSHAVCHSRELEQGGSKLASSHLYMPPGGDNVWEIDTSQLKYESKLASGLYGDLYKGTFYGQDVAIKLLRSEHLNENLQKEFSQEVNIMRRIQHKNVVQFIGACTRPPKLCIVTEFMSGGSIYDLLHKQKSGLKLPLFCKVAIDISKGMSYLHENKIMHRDLKSANLLMDEKGVVKVADFGVARVQAQSGVMTAETGTYRWMAPE